VVENIRPATNSVSQIDRREKTTTLTDEWFQVHDSETQRGPAEDFRRDERDCMRSAGGVPCRVTLNVLKRVIVGERRECRVVIGMSCSFAIHQHRATPCPFVSARDESNSSEFIYSAIPSAIGSDSRTDGRNTASGQNGLDHSDDLDGQSKLGTSTLSSPITANRWIHHQSRQIQLPSPRCDLTLRRK
jgi:hypothetical protein